jgi:dihydroorotate dehydrogenase
MIQLINRAYQFMLPLTLRTDAQTAHDQFIAALRWADNNALGQWAASRLGAWTLPAAPVTVGGVTLPYPLILSAGLVKGDGFEDEAAALGAVDAGRNIIPGWQVMPRIAGPVEFGSYTRYPRLGNPGTVIWRKAATRSTQNRVGLRNPGAAAAARFLAQHADDLPAVYGLNIAVSPGVDDPAQERDEVTEALALFQDAGVRPSWVTLNLSCPNTEDDPAGNQTETKARDLCGTLVKQLDGSAPLWVKISPGLSDVQYAGLMSAFAAVGVTAVIATNTQATPTPDGGHMAGVGGGDLHLAAVSAVRALDAVRKKAGYNVGVIGCGGVLDGASYRAHCATGADALMYYSALIYRGPTAGAIIYQEGTST